MGHVQTHITQMEPLEQTLFCPAAYILSSFSREPLSPALILHGLEMTDQIKDGCVSGPVSQSISLSWPQGMDEECTDDPIRVKEISWDSCKDKQECLHLGRPKTR